MTWTRDGAASTIVATVAPVGGQYVLPWNFVSVLFATETEPWQFVYWQNSTNVNESYEAMTTATPVVFWNRQWSIFQSPCENVPSVRPEVSIACRPPVTPTSCMRKT